MSKKLGSKNRKKVYSDLVELQGHIVVPRRFTRGHVKQWRSQDADSGDILRSYAPFVLEWHLTLIDLDEAGEPVADADGNVSGEPIDASIVDWEPDDVPYIVESFIARAVSPLVTAAFSPKKTPRG